MRFLMVCYGICEINFLVYTPTKSSFNSTLLSNAFIYRSRGVLQGSFKKRKKVANIWVIETLKGN